MSARGCSECGGIYHHYGLCSHLPSDSEAGKRRDSMRIMTEADNLARLSDTEKLALLAKQERYYSGRTGDADKIMANAARDLLQSECARLYLSGRLVLLPSVEELADILEAQMGPLVGSPEYLADPVKRARSEKRRREGALTYATAIHNHLKGTGDE